MSNWADIQAFVPGRSAGRAKVISLARSVDRSVPPTIRATALVFEDPASVAVRQDLDRLAPSDANLVIQGETGSGKELAARYLHEHSSRRGGPFVAVNCGALVDTLVEAELFGYERGAFTGAIKDQVGWFEAAHGGTLLLDEIGDLPLALQVKLLRVLQEREVVRLGSRSPVAVDVRVIAATNVDLKQAVASGQFRQDLYFRLNVATIWLPPLRDRPRDIPLLADHFLGIYREKMDRDELTLSANAMATLVANDWPGNIRELENVIHNAVLLSPGPAIEPRDLRLGKVADGRATTASFDDKLTALLRKGLADSETDLFGRVTSLLVAAAFEASQNNQVRAAETLGISRNAMRTQLARLGVIAGRASRRSEGS